MSNSKKTIATDLGESRSRASNGRIAFTLLILLAVVVATRVAWLLIAPESMSSDLIGWDQMADQMCHGANPYDYHGRLNYFPFWLEVMYAALIFSSKLHLSFIFCIRMVLIAGDMALLASTFWLMRLIDPNGRQFRILLVGYCLSPMLILLTVQHGNFDALVAIWAVLLCCFLVRYRHSGEPEDWLLAAACMGIGIFVKTVPLLLWPLLACRTKTLNAKTLVIGTALAIGPPMLSMLPVYVLDPQPITKHVLEYRGVLETFGVLSFFHLSSERVYLGEYSDAFPYLYLSTSVLLAAYLRASDLKRDCDLSLLAALLFLSTWLFGAGYATQHWFWVVPFLLVCYGCYGLGFNVLLWIFMIVVNATLVVQYAVEPLLGTFWSHWHPSPALADIGWKFAYSDQAQSLLQLPMTLICMAVFVVGIVHLSKKRQVTLANGSNP